MTRDVEMLQYLPPFLQEYREIQEIIKSENPEFQIAENERELILNNQFIQTCNEVGIRKFESMMDISPLEEDNLQTRIARVLARWNDTIPYTYRVLEQKLFALCGPGNYKIDLDADNYTITIAMNTIIIGRLQELKYLLKYFLPANLISIIELFEIEPKTLYVGAVIRQYSKIRLKGGI